MNLREFIYNPPVDPYLSVIYQDEDLLVVDKPSGLLSVPGKAVEHADCLDLRARQTYPQSRIVHRLDMDTSGLLVLAMNAKAHRHLGLQFERRHIKKTYQARVWGVLETDSGTVDQPLICDWPNRPRQMIDHQRGKPSQTDWQVLDRESQITRLELKPLTGRSHQLRVHLLFLGHPILGDNLYAHEDALTAADRLQLHAQSLTLFHPADGRICDFVSDCPF